jgi:8-oxo-dGTP pyrophosphatase MutT (NUDIX family)
MKCVIMDLCCVRVAVVKVDRARLVEPLATRTLRDLQPRFGVLPILLVAFSDTDLVDLHGFSEFPTAPYLDELVEWNDVEPVEWVPLPELVEPELPF